MHNSEGKDAVVDKLYLAHKARHKAPESLKRRVLSSAARAQRQGRHRGFPVRMLLGVAASAALLCLFALNLLVNRQLQWQPQDQSIHVQLHGFGDEPEQLPLSERLVMAKAQHFANYQGTQFTLDVHHNKQARLVAMDNGLSLMTCDDELVRISATLLTDFRQRRRIDSYLQLGQWLDIGYDSTGYIQRIGAGAKPKGC